MAVLGDPRVGARSRRRLLLRLLASFVLAIPVVAAVALASRTSEGNSTGAPLAWSSPVPLCVQPNPFNGCGFVYSPPIIVLDYVIWAVIVFALLLWIDAVRRHVAKG